MNELEFTIEKLYELYETQGFYVNTKFYKKTGEVGFGIEEKREEEC